MVLLLFVRRIGNSGRGIMGFGRHSPQVKWLVCCHPAACIADHWGVAQHTTWVLKRRSWVTPQQVRGCPVPRTPYPVPTHPGPCPASRAASMKLERVRGHAREPLGCCGGVSSGCCVFRTPHGGLRMLFKSLERENVDWTYDVGP